LKEDKLLQAQCLLVFKQRPYDCVEVGWIIRVQMTAKFLLD